jgi:hypothetical protein
VVVAQRLDAQMRRPGEVSDRQRGTHPPSLGSPTTGESTLAMGLDPPVVAAVSVEGVGHLTDGHPSAQWKVTC